MAKKNSLVHRSVEIDEIIGRPPHWLIQWGISVFFVVLLLVLFSSYFIEYPEKVYTSFTIVPDKRAIPIVATEDGVILKLLGKEGSHMQKNDTLFYWRRIGNAKTLAILAPESGKIEFISTLNNGDRVTKRQYLMFIVPASHVYYATMYVHNSDIRKIKIGQKVIINMPGYPPNIYGTFSGVINYIGTVKSAVGYYVKIKLPNGLKSDIGQTIYYRKDIQGNAEITIDKTRLIYKFFHKKSTIN